MQASKRHVNTLLRTRQSHEDSKVGFVELFFDLVFVFAITQLSHSLLHDFSLKGMLQTGFLMLAVWWVWIYTTWVTNWLDPQKTPVRLMLFSLMLSGLILAISIPHAFKEMGLIFACTYTFIQCSRSTFMCWSLYGHAQKNFKNFCRITAWLLFAGIFWVSGGFTHNELRYSLWAIALMIEAVGPIALFWTPTLGRSATSDWNISGAHMAERCGLFIIIVLGESLLVTGHTFAELDWTIAKLSGFLTAFISTVAMWWIYFNVSAGCAAKHIEKSNDPGYVARIAYTYLHIPIIAGMILAAVSDGFIIKHPLTYQTYTSAITSIALLGAPIIFLSGNVLFKKVMLGSYDKSHLTGIALLILSIPTYTMLPPLCLALIATLTLIGIGAWESATVTCK